MKLTIISKNKTYIVNITFQDKASEEKLYKKSIISICKKQLIEVKLDRKKRKELVQLFRKMLYLIQNEDIDYLILDLKSVEIDISYGQYGNRNIFICQFYQQNKIIKKINRKSQKLGAIK